MIEDRIRKFIGSVAISDCLLFKTNVEYKKNEFWHRNNLCMSYISQQMMLTIKSLMPSKNEVSVRVDMDRFKREFDLWQNYKVGDNLSLRELSNEEIYWKEYDESVIARVIPLIVVNRDFDVIVDEAIKLCLFSSGNIKSLLESIVILRIMFDLLNNPNIEYETLNENIKQAIIAISIKDIIDRKLFRYSIQEKEKKYVISFERDRIAIITLLNGFGMNGKYELLKSCLNLIKGEEDNAKSELDSYVFNSLSRIVGDEKTEENFINKSFLSNMVEYMIKLRKGRISPEQLEIKTNVYPDVFAFNDKEEFYHTLLNKCTVISKQLVGKELIMAIKNKSAIFIFHKQIDE